jgi:hypothetical protein
VSDAYVFGDIEPADAYSAGVGPAVEQVAMRLHELREYLDSVAGEHGLLRWDELTPAEQQLALAIGDVIVTHLAGHEPDAAEDSARNLHNVRRYWASSRLPAWEDLPPDDRQVGIDLMSAIINWLAREGTLV